MQGHNPESATGMRNSLRKHGDGLPDEEAPGQNLGSTLGSVICTHKETGSTHLE